MAIDLPQVSIVWECGCQLLLIEMKFVLDKATDLQQGGVVERCGCQLLLGLLIRSGGIAVGRPEAVAVRRQFWQREGAGGDGGNQANGKPQRPLQALRLRPEQEHWLPADATSSPQHWLLCFCTCITCHAPTTNQS